MSDEMEKKEEDVDEGIPEYMGTYGDMVTLLLCFFVLLMNPETIDNQRMQLIMASFNRMGVLTGGNTLQQGDLAELGNTVVSLPSTVPLRRLDRARQSATAVFETEVVNKQIEINEEERGLVITLAGDLFFEEGSAEIDLEKARPTLQKLSGVLTLPDLSGLRYRIEGHTDSIQPDPDSPWPTNWELSTARAVNILHRLADLGVDENRFHIAGYADTSPKIGSDDSTPEGRALLRRVDVVILKEGHLTYEPDERITS